MHEPSSARVVFGNKPDRPCEPLCSLRAADQWQRECERLRESFQRVAEKQQSTYSKRLDAEQRAEQAEREGTELRKRITEAYGWKCELERERDEARAELAELKAWKLDCERNCLAKDREERIPLAQHDAALAQARAEERARANHPHGERHGCAKWTDEQMALAVASVQQGDTVAAVARRLGADVEYFRKVVKGYKRQNTLQVGRASK